MISKLESLRETYIYIYILHAGAEEFVHLCPLIKLCKYQILKTRKIIAYIRCTLAV